MCSLACAHPDVAEFIDTYTLDMPVLYTLSMHFLPQPTAGRRCGISRTCCPELYKFQAIPRIFGSINCSPTLLASALPSIVFTAGSHLHLWPFGDCVGISEVCTNLSQRICCTSREFPYASFELNAGSQYVDLRANIRLWSSGYVLIL